MLSPEMILPSGKAKRTDAQLTQLPDFDQGAEMTVSRARIQYKNMATPMDGLVLKVPIVVNDPVWVQHFLESVIQRWRILKEINIRRKKEGKTIFRLPSTVRIYRDEKRSGLLVTDLTKGGRYLAYDAKELAYHPTLLTMQEWNSVRKQIEKDLEIATEEQIKLDSGPKNIDPWLLVKEPSGWNAYLSDIGGFTSFYTGWPLTPQIAKSLETSNRNIRETLDEIENTLLESSDADEA